MGALPPMIAQQLFMSIVSTPAKGFEDVTVYGLPYTTIFLDSLGWVFYKLGRLDEALVELQRAYDAFDDHEVAAHLVEVLVALDRRTDALELLDASQLENPDSALLEDVRTRFFPDTP